MSTSRYDAFLSYASVGDYQTARRVEAFLESVHKAFAAAGANLRRLSICRDGSDFKLPKERPGDPTSGGDSDPIWNVILAQLQKADHLIVLCSPESVGSPWVAKEIKWFVENRGVGQVLPVVTHALNPIDHPTECFPQELIAAGIHTSRIWYDLRSFRSPRYGHQIKDKEDELVRLAGDLLDWDADTLGPLSTLWQREQLRVRRRRAQITTLTAALFIVLAGVATWKALEARQAAIRARVAALVNIAKSQGDPSSSALVLNEVANLVGDGAPYGATNLAHQLATAPRPRMILRGHQGAVVSVAFSHRGDRLLTASEDGTARIWDLTGKRAPLVLSGSDALTEASFGADDDRVVTADVGGSAHIWNSDGTGPPIVLKGHRGAIRTARFSADGARIVTASDDGTARVWTVSTRAAPIILAGHQGGVTFAQFNKQGDRVFTASSDGHVGLWQADGTGEPTFFAFPGLVKLTGAQFSSDETMILLTSRDSTGWLMRTTPSKFPLITLPGHTDEVSSANFSPNGEWIVTAARDGGVRIWSVARLHSDGGNESDSSFDMHIPIRKAIFNPDSTQIALAADDGSTRVWTLDESRQSVLLQGHEGPVLDEAFSSDGRLLVTGSSDATVRVWNPETLQEPQIVSIHPGPVEFTQINAFSERLLTITKDGRVWLWRKQDSGYVESYRGELPVRMAKLSENGRLLFAIFRDGTAALFDVDNDMKSLSLPPLPDSIHDAAVSPGGKFLATIAGPGIVQVWPLGGGAALELKGHEGDVSSVKFSRDGRWVVTAGQDRTVRIWPADRPGDALVFRGHGAPVLDASFSTDGRHVVSVSSDATARIWDITGKVGPKILRGHLGPVTSAAFSEDGLRLITGSLDGARVWRLDKPDEPVELKADAGQIHAVGINAAGTEATTASNDGRIFMWHVDWAWLINELRRTSKMCLSADQRIRWLAELDTTAQAAYANCQRNLVLPDLAPAATSGMRIVN